MVDKKLKAISDIHAFQMEHMLKLMRESKSKKINHE